MNLRRVEAVLPAAGTGVPPRRDLLCGLASVGLALGIVGRPDPASAKKKRKRKKKVKFNDFGCVNVGSFCKTSEHCCSGICEGKQDKKTCRAHDTGGCTLDRTLCFNPTIALCGPMAVCTTTTGNAPFCADAAAAGYRDAFCQVCSKDEDCVALGFGAGSACAILRTEGACPEGCEGFNGSSGTGCLPPLS
jgi:hypothetical protein